MKISCMRLITLLLGLVMLPLTAGTAFGRDITLISKGVANCVIVTPPDSLVWEGSDKVPPISWATSHVLKPDRDRRRLRDSIRDLAFYLGKMSGATVDIVEGLPSKEKRLPLYIGAEAEKVFGPVGKTFKGRFAFRVVVTRKGIGLYGESDEGTLYAIYELLHRLGCRWYMPSEMGECIPEQATVTLEEMDESLAPATEWRYMQGRTNDSDFQRRNRLGDWGNELDAGHCLEGYVSKEQRKAHPEWCLQVEGKPHPLYLRWTRQDVANAIADTIIARLDKNYVPTISLSPGDYVVPTDDPEEMKHDPTPRVWEPAANQWSVTDRLILLTTRIAERVGKKYPKVTFGVLVYVNYSMPPAQQKVHPNVIPMLAHIDFNRMHPMTAEGHPNQTWLLDMVQGWAKAAPRICYYAYGMNLAELTAPNPFITKWGTDIPIILKNHCTMWRPETMGGWESMMPGFYLSTRLTFYPEEKPEAILSEMMERFYGAASEPMGEYWHDIDRAWIDAKEYSGCGFGYLRIFTPEVMKSARASIDEALSKCNTIMEYRRVRLIDESLRLFEQFMKMRHDFADASFRFLARDLDDWRGAMRYLRKRYKKQYSFDTCLALDYVNWFFARPYEGATQMWKQYTQLGRPMLEWKFQYDKEKQAEALGWTKPDFDDAQWQTTHVVTETWSTIGHHNTMGRMAYRATVNLYALAAGKKAFLWIGSTDGSAKLFVNGKHVPYTVEQDTRQNKKGETIEAFSGYCTPASFDVTAFVTKGKNQITIVCERNWLNELGTGGLMGPVVVYRER